MYGQGRVGTVSHFTCSLHVMSESLAMTYEWSGLIANMNILKCVCDICCPADIFS